MARSAMYLSVIASSAFLAAVRAQPNTQLCQFNGTWGAASYSGVNFDVCSLFSPGANYMWSDPFDYESFNSVFYFNVGGDAINPNPSICPPGAVGAYQISNNSVCTTLAYSTARRPLIYSQQFIDTSNPARGFVLTMGGPSSGQCQNGQPQSFSIAFGCHASGTFPPAGTLNQRGFVLEQNTCDFTAFAFSTAGCPIECPRVNGAVCGGNGVCGYDSAINSARCFCYDNWLESDCQTPANPFPGGSVAGATIGGIILGAAVLLGFSYWKRGSAGAPQIKTGEGFY